MTLKFSIELTKKDFLYFTNCYCANSSTVQASIIKTRIKMAILLVAYLAFGFYNVNVNLQFSLTLLVIAVVWYIFLNYRGKIISTKSIIKIINEAKMDQLLGAKYVEIYDEMVVCSQNESSSPTMFSSICRIVEDDKILLLYNSAVSALYFTKSKTPVEALEFLRNVMNNKSIIAQTG